VADKNSGFLIEKYLVFLKNKGLHDLTIQKAEAALHEFINFLISNRNINNIREVEKKDVEGFVLQLDQRKRQNSNEKLSVSFKNDVLSTVKRFVTFLAANEYIMTDIARDIILFPNEKRLPRNILSEKEIKVFFDSIDKKRITGQRDFCIFRLLYHTGLRKGEVEKLNVWDIDLDDGQMLVEGKFSKKRFIPLAENISKILGEYLKQVRPVLVKNNPGQELMFTTQKGEKFSKNIICLMTKKYAESGSTKDVTAHSFRHTFATHLLNRGASIRHIQQILGHESLCTTEIYTRVSIKDLKKVYDRTHPRAILFEGGKKINEKKKIEKNRKKT